ncbi:MAG: copper resistance protein B [Alphaproteobacteria bacterium]|jgi:copper resistance protein B|nr:copper resistance protein B [Alphaproteobacteria bacterium]MBU2040680.1 copper resistance protein B [Alphaproteobacteria bacterium]MBU2126632.1 copper resistance protein B [Alphaproteobacteria bacterium]MBU2208622.1 copper resistance protein B [Alphaproteobacteria bacterium]MBU2290763.1 copper resistance protein B [Alphaproteobacteria bacterium]
MNRLAVALAPLILAATGFSAQAQDPHAGHAMPAPTRPASAPSATPQTPVRPAMQDPHAGHVMPSAQTPPAGDPHAGHQMQVQPATVDPHAGHDMSTRAPARPDPHAGHDMSTMPSAPADPHAGHDMSTMNMGPPDVPTGADNPGRPPEDPLPAAALGGPRHAADLIFGAETMAAARTTLVRENGDVRATAVIIDRLEAGFGDEDETWLWDVQGWSGGDINRFWWKSEGEGDFDDGLEEAELQALYSRAVTPFWDVQAGVRQDFRPDGEDTTHLVLGLQGLAPYWWEVDAAAFLSTEGDLTARVEAEYDQRITQRLILQPRLEIDASASDIPELEIGSGLSSVEAGLRLRYEFRKEFAPYLGVEWSRSFGDTADYIEARGGEVDATRVVVGLKAWF